MSGPTLEQVAFRWVVIVAAAAVSIGVLTALTSSLVGALWGLALVLVAAGVGLRAWRRHRPRARRRIVVLAEGPLDSRSLRVQVGERWTSEPHDVLIVVPSRHRGCSSLIERERQGMELSLQAVRELGARASGRVVEDGVVAAARAAHDEFAPDELLIATKPPRDSEWGDIDPLEGSVGTAVTRAALVTD